nr:hypothetical protein [Actinomadura madurae]
MGRAQPRRRRPDDPRDAARQRRRGRRAGRLTAHVRRPPPSTRVAASAYVSPSRAVTYAERGSGRSPSQVRCRGGRPRFTSAGPPPGRAVRRTSRPMCCVSRRPGPARLARGPHPGHPAVHRRAALGHVHRW